MVFVTTAGQAEELLRNENDGLRCAVGGLATCLAVVMVSFHFPYGSLQTCLMANVSVQYDVDDVNNL